jgi:flagellar protein FliS
MYSNGSNAYREIAVQTSSPARLVVMLYEGGIRFLRESVSAIESKDLTRKRHSVDRAMAIIQHLESTLDADRGGEVAQNLGRLYSYITARILEGSSRLETAPLEEAIKLLNVLLSAWEELAGKEQPQTGPAAAVAQQAANGGLKLHA